MNEENQLSILKKFISNDDVQAKLFEINNNLMDFNILEITGMGHQEIKHSNILGWFFDKNEHNLEYLIFEDFLKEVHKVNADNNELQSYIYSPKNKRDLTIEREKNNIDLLIVDNANNVVITVENKIFASERSEGEDGGQLQKYEKYIQRTYDGYTQFFIFLTKDLIEASKENWLNANHQMVTDTLNKILKDKKDISTKTRIIFDSYIDLLKRRGIVKDTQLEKLCKEIWNNDNYKPALDILMANQPNKLEKFIQHIKSFSRINIAQNIYISKNPVNIFIDFKNKSNLVYQFMYSKSKKQFLLVIVSEDENIESIEELKIEDKHLKMDNRYKMKNSQKRNNYYTVSGYTGYDKNWSDENISENFIHRILQTLLEYDDKYANNIQ